jgi:hypothetical protein
MSGGRMRRLRGVAARVLSLRRGGRDGELAASSRRPAFDPEEHYGAKVERDASGRPLLGPIGDLEAIIETPDWHVPEWQEPDEPDPG